MKLQFIQSTMIFCTNLASVKSVKCYSSIALQYVNNKTTKIHQYNPILWNECCLILDINLVSSIKMYLLDTEQREHLKLLRENNSDGNYLHFIIMANNNMKSVN